MKRYLPSIIDSTEIRVGNFLKKQISDSTQPDFGGLRQNIIDIKPTAYDLLSVVSVYLYEDSRYYKSKVIPEAVRLALDFIERELRPDGTVDYPSCNFASAPDTAFCLVPLIPCYRLLLKYLPEQELNDIKGQLYRIIRHSLDGIMNGGFHTPNHRWAIAAALMQGYNLFKDELISSAFLNKANQYLAEGIDGNEDGEYAERSTGGYNAVVNASMITLYEETGDETYLGYVTRNLEMMLHYFEPDDTIFTQNSTRQDKGKRQYADNYFYQFLYMAQRGNKNCDGAAHKLIRDNIERRDECPQVLGDMMLQSQLMEHEFKNDGFMTNYRKYFKDSGVVRYRSGDFSYSILRDSRNFLFIQMKDIQYFVRLGISYCDIRSFTAQSIKKTDDGYHLEFDGKGWYYKPFEVPQETSDWWKMNHKSRELLINTELHVDVLIHEKDKGIELELRTSGCNKIPIRLEIAIPDNTDLETDNMIMTGEAGRHMILKNDMLHATHHEVTSVIGPGFGEHRFVGHYSGEVSNDNHFTVIMTDYTPVTKTIQLSFKS